MLDFFKKIFGTENSSATAKERLKLVLLSDHLSLAPDVVERLKADLLEVISRYVDIDHSHADVSFEHRDREIAMLANVPILGLRDGRGGPPFRGGHDATPPLPTSAPFRPAPDLTVATTPERVVAPEPEFAVTIEPEHTVADVEPALALAVEPECVAALEPEHASVEQLSLAEAPKAANAPKRSNNGSRRRRRRKPTAPKKAPAPNSLNSLGAMPRPAQA